MDDKQILDLYWERSEAAISETSKKYGKYCRYIAFNILHNDEDSEECVNDTYLRAWNSIPPNRPSVLKTFLGKITRTYLWTGTNCLMQRNVMVGKCHWFLMKYKSAYHRWIVQKTLLKKSL